MRDLHHQAWLLFKKTIKENPEFIFGIVGTAGLVTPFLYLVCYEKVRDDLKIKESLIPDQKDGKVYCTNSE